MLRTRVGSCVCGAILAAVAVSARAADPKPPVEYLVKKGQTIAFLGDSITAGGARKGGYCRLVLEALNEEGLEVTGIFAGKSGHKSNDMLARLDKDVIGKRPDWMTLSCGVNDVWHFKLRLGRRTFKGVPLKEYKENIAAIIDKAQAAGIKVVVLTLTMIGEDPERELNRNLIPYNEFLRQIAREKKCPLADLDRDMRAALKEIPDVPGRARMFGEPHYDRMIKNKLTSDGCHMNARGNAMMADGVLRALRVPEPEPEPATPEVKAPPKDDPAQVEARRRAKKARRLYEMAAQAERMRQRAVAMEFYSKVLKDYPETPHAARAAKKLDALRK